MAEGVKIIQLANGGNVRINDLIPVSRGGVETVKLLANQFVTAGVNIGLGTGELYSDKTTNVPTSLTFRKLSADNTLQINTVDASVTFTISNSAITTSKLNNQAVTIHKVDTDFRSYLVPLGAIMPFGILPLPDGWVICDGTVIPSTGTFQNIPAEKLQNLRAALGTIYGTYGQLPNLQGQFIRGLTTNNSTITLDPSGTNRILGAVQYDSIKNHTHSGTTGDDSPDHTHNFKDYYQRNIVEDFNPFRGVRDGTRNLTEEPEEKDNTTFGANSKHQHPFTTSSMSPAGDVETRPVNIALVYGIKY